MLRTWKIIRSIKHSCRACYIFYAFMFYFTRKLFKSLLQHRLFVCVQCCHIQGEKLWCSHQLHQCIVYLSSEHGQINDVAKF